MTGSCEAGSLKSYEEKALERAEEIGVIEYNVNNYMEGLVNGRDDS